MNGLHYDDTRKWGAYSYLDFLEINEVPYFYDGRELSFPSSEDRAKAAKIWESLTGMQQIGAV